MEEETVKKLIEKYIKGWKDRDLEMLLSVLHAQIEVRECTGAVYQGKETLEKWFTDWNQGTNKILYWKINSLSFDENKSVAFFEWKFKCFFEDKEYEFEGLSIIYFKDKLIFRIKEYEMKLEKFYPYG